MYVCVGLFYFYPQEDVLARVLSSWSSSGCTRVGDGGGGLIAFGVFGG